MNRIGTQQQTFHKLLSTMQVLIQLFFRLIDWLLSYLRSFWERWTGPILSLDSGRRVRIGSVIAEGGFSIVFRATEAGSSGASNTVYALKRIRCEEQETLQLCRKEASVHRTVGSQHANVMPLLGMAVEDKQCYMLFPYMPHSLRDEVNRRIFYKQVQHQGPQSRASPFPTQSFNNKKKNHGLDSIPPWSEIQALQIFRGVLDGIDAIHRANFSHRDIKLENILFRGSNNLTTPVVTDFGSSGPLSEPLQSRRDVIGIAETASSHTTMPYRPPELFEGGVRVGEADLDFAKVDVWSLGCVLYGMLYGASPFECEYNRSNGQIKIVDCTQLRVIGSLPFPPPHTAPSNWYSQDLTHDLIPWMLTQDRTKRPTLIQVIARVDSFLQEDTDTIDVLINRNVM